jgi:hypothetical protein
MSNVDQKLDEIALKQMVWKNQKLLTACLLIAEKALEQGTFWPDSLVFYFLLIDDDRNCIGSAWRLVTKTLGIIEKTGDFRRSMTKGQNGRMIFRYRLINEGMARAFLKRYNLDKQKGLAHPQLLLGI